MNKRVTFKRKNFFAEVNFFLNEHPFQKTELVIPVYV